MKAKLAASVGALAISVSALASAATPLELRHDGSSVAAPPSQSSSTSSAGWKLAGIAAVIGGVAVWMRKRRTAKGGITAPSEIRVVARTSIGGRNELLVVDIGGQRILLGATPSSIRHLADVDHVAETTRASEPGERIAPTDVSTRFRALIESALDDEPPHRSSHSSLAPRSATADPVETQAKNLLVLRRKP